MTDPLNPDKYIQNICHQHKINFNYYKTNVTYTVYFVQSINKGLLFQFIVIGISDSLTNYFPTFFGNVTEATICPCFWIFENLLSGFIMFFHFFDPLTHLNLLYFVIKISLIQSYFYLLQKCQPFLLRASRKYYLTF